MEFTVSKSDLVRELSLSQGVVEKKTTIPILSNVLLEAAGDRVTLTATDLELGIRCSCPARVKKEGAGTVPARKLLDYVRLLPEGDVEHEVPGEPLGEHHQRALADAHRGHVARKFSGIAADAGADRRDSGQDALAAMIARTQFAISMEESRFTLNGALLLMQAGRLDDGGHRRPSPGVRAGFGRRQRARRSAIPRVDSEESDGGIDQACR